MKTIRIIAVLLIAASTVFGQNKEEHAMETKKITVEVWSDIVCPYCYLGKKKLEFAIEKLGLQHEVNVIWNSYQLDEDFPVGVSIPTTTYLIEHRGFPENNMQSMYDRLKDWGNDYDIVFSFDKAMSFNTYNAHRLWIWSQTKKKENELKEALMQAYFTDGIDLSDNANLAKVAASVGLDETEALAVLQSEDYALSFQQHINKASEMGVSGVPYFLINNNTVISGAQDDRIFEEALLEAAKSKH